MRRAPSIAFLIATLACCTTQDESSVTESLAAATAYTQQDQYVAACEREVGRAPDFDCLDGELLPVTVGGKAVNYPTAQCDRPTWALAFIMPDPRSACTTGARLGHLKGEGGTEWTFLCRRTTFDGNLMSPAFDDVSLLGHRAETGATCFYQGIRTTRNVASPRVGVYNPSWEGPGYVARAQCIFCHDSNAYVHTPFVDQASVKVPKQYHTGDEPYRVINRVALGWPLPKYLTSDKAAACTSCHRIGNIRSCDLFTKLATGTRPSYDDSRRHGLNLYTQKLERTMPPGHAKLEKKHVDAIAEIERCCWNQGDPSCGWTAINEGQAPH